MFARKYPAISEKKIPFSSPWLADSLPRVKSKLKYTMMSRKRRIRNTVNGVKIAGTIMGSIGLYEAFKGAWISNPSFKSALVSLVSEVGRAATIAAPLGALVGNMVGSDRVKRATLIIGKELFKASKKDASLHHFLSDYKYVFINRKGDLCGTNVPRFFGIGRMRLKTKEILNGSIIKRLELLKQKTA